MSTGVLDRNAYTIGWICALSVESAAAQVFLDERHQVPSDVSDSNSYVTGRIGKHNVVIAVMPQNEYGTATAATTAKDMVRSFPQVRLGLMVGIGGGVPSQEHDIRLGDVVVSSRGKGIGGVIQFDYGKTIQGQDFKETGHLNQPPTALMTAVAALEAQYDLEGPQLDEKVGDALQNHRKAFKTKYARPSDETDRLYRPEFTHPDGPPGDCFTTCGVRQDDLVHRSPRGTDDDNPTVHYGLIASSNQVMKDAVKRDEWIQRGVLCFEMEAAGLMNHFPCLVVRGICDYADTHKNSSWQPYAAMVAAAYAKDLLGKVNPGAVQMGERLSAIIESVEQVASTQLEQTKIANETKVAVDGIEFRQRVHHDNPKHEVVESIPEILVKKADGSFRYAACQIDDIVECFNPTEIEKVLMSLPETIKETYERSIEKIPQKHLFMAVRLLQILVDLERPLELSAAVDVVAIGPKFERFNVTDRTRPEYIVRLCPNLLSIVEVGNYGQYRYRELHLAHLSVKEFLIQYRSPAATFVGGDASVNIVRTCLSYIASHDLESSLGNVEFPFETHARDMWIKHATAAEASLDAVAAMADYLKTNSENPNIFWRPAYSALRPHGVRAGDFAASCLHFTCYSNLRETSKLLISAGVPLDCRSSGYGSGISPLEVAAHMNQPEIVQLLLDTSAGLDIIGAGSFIEALYISYENGNRGISKLLVRRALEASHLGYDWHDVQSTMSMAIARNDIDFIELLLDEGFDVSAIRGHRRTALLDASGCGFDHIVAMLLRRGATVNYEDDSCFGAATALQAASEYGHQSTVNLLIDNGANVNSQCGSYGTALQAAARAGYQEIVKLLIYNGANVNSRSGYYGTALQAAAQAGYQEIVNLLIHNGANVNSRSGFDGGTALQAAAQAGHQEIVEVLVDAGADIDAQGGQYGNPLTGAGIGDHTVTLKYLLDKGADINAHGIRSNNALNWILMKTGSQASEKRVQTIQLLLDYEPKVCAGIRSSRDALRIAVKRGSSECTKILLKHGARVKEDSPEKISSMLRYAVLRVLSRGFSREYADIVRLLLDAGANPNTSLDHVGIGGKDSLLMQMLFRSQLEIAQELLRYGANPNTMTCRRVQNQTALHVALERDYDEIKDPIRYQPGKGGGFERTEAQFRNFISKDSNSKFPAEKGRYALYVSPGCPWCHRAMIVRALKRLEDYVDLYIADMGMGKEGWHFTDSPEAAKYGVLPEDPVYGFKTIKELYLKASPGYEGRVTVPVLWDKKAHTLVSNESSEIIRMLYTEFDHLLPEADREDNRPGRGLYPQKLQREIDEINEWVYHTVNNGVYKCGFAFTQAAYEDNVDHLFQSLDRLESILKNRPFLLGDTITEADVRLFPTIARFDVAYVPIFQCNLGTIRNDYPNLHLWYRRLYWDQSERTHGAFFNTTDTWISRFKEGYGNARARVLGIQGPLIIPKGPRVLIHELKDEEKL
ncbi:Glutathione S-transferase omega-like 2 [Colletotrichum siamense]|nr:Glutathione S-transferase omega-like 2 [Colletotrichum siamense]